MFWKSVRLFGMFGVCSFWSWIGRISQLQTKSKYIYSDSLEWIEWNYSRLKMKRLEMKLFNWMKFPRNYVFLFSKFKIFFSFLDFEISGMDVEFLLKCLVPLGWHIENLGTSFSSYNYICRFDEKKGKSYFRSLRLEKVALPSAKT